MIEEIPFWQKIEQLHKSFPEHQYPSVTIVVPTFNNAQRISITMESLVNQNYPDFEILVVDAGSTDRTVEIVQSYRDGRIRLYSMTGFNRYEMINKGISLGKGVYFNTLFPGDYYISKETLRIIMGLAIEQEEPALVYCGTLLREAEREVKILYRPLSFEYLKRGQQPTSLQSCWFHMRTFSEIGKFNTNYQLRGGYEFLSRFLINGTLTCSSTGRILTDYDLRGVTRHMVVRHFLETFRTIFKYFGLSSMLRWLFFYQKDTTRYFCLWWRSFKVAVLGLERTTRL